MSNILKEQWTKDFYGRLDLHKNGMQSIAGYGSSMWNVRNIIRNLPIIFDEYGIQTLLDIPCGDYYWMKEVELSNIKYIGGDLVDEQIQYNKEKYPDVDFRVINMIEDSLPQADLVYTRDCLVHLTFNNARSFIEGLIRSGSKYFMSTHFPEVERNDELVGIIGWRPLNLEIAPFNFPKPLKLISENSDYNPEKCMGLWSIDEISKTI